MTTIQAEHVGTEVRNRDQAAEVRYERWKHWPIHWSAIWVGALAAFCTVLLFGLIGIALGAHLLGPEHRIVDVRKLSIGALIFSVCGAFFSFALGGWVAGKIAGILHAEPGMLQGAIVWLVAVPILVVAAGLGAASFLGGWYTGLGPTSTTAPFLRPDPLGPGASADEIATYQAQLAQYHQNLRQWQEDTPKAVRASALGAVTALLLGLVGSVLGGWMATGEPMNFSHHRTRKPLMYYEA